MGSFRAVKLIRRSGVAEARAYEREFAGIRRFEPISRSHSAFVNILHIGRNDESAYFYYIMELADDTDRGQQIDEATYRPRSLSSDLDAHRRFDFSECLQMGITLAQGLEHLHGLGLLHRDIKPANIIFVQGKVKYADIGLVTEMSQLATFVGTEGYVPPEGPGKPTADIFGLGKLLYEVATGNNIEAFPEMPTDRDTRWSRLFEIVLKACHPTQYHRYQTAAELGRDLVELSQITVTDPRASITPVLFGQEEEYPEAGGAVPLDSRFYIERAADKALNQAITRGDSTVLVKGARQMGKTSLLARGLQAARQNGLSVVLTDFQKLNVGGFESLGHFYIALAESVADQLDLHSLLEESWDNRGSPNVKFERYLRRVVFPTVRGRLVWGMDEVDRLFGTPFGTEVFGLFRSWHNQRALDPRGPWAHLSLVLTYATEAHLFIQDLAQSPFNIGTPAVLSDFSRDELNELHERYGSPLKDDSELERLFKLLGGQPFLTRCALHQLAQSKVAYDTFEADALSENGPFAGHLRRLLMSVGKDPKLVETLQLVLAGHNSISPDQFYRLRTAGVIVGESARVFRWRCALYEHHMRRQLSAAE